MRKILVVFLVFAWFQTKAQLNYTVPAYSYDSLLNVTYGTAVDYAGNTETLELDIYKPNNDFNCKRPAIILVHGGDWIAGSKEDPDIIYMARQLAGMGWVVASINYRLGTHKAANYDMYALCNNSVSSPCSYICDSSEIFRANFRGMQDVKGAIRFMKDRSIIDSSDVNNFYIAGESAGGFISFAAAFTDQVSEKSADCYSIGDAPAPDADLNQYGCIPSSISYSRPDLGSIDGTLNLGSHDATVKGIGNYFGGLFNFNVLQQLNDTPAVYLYHQGSDVVVNYGYGQLLGRISWECYAQTNLCQSYYFYPWAYGSEGIKNYLDSIAPGIPYYLSEIIYNYSYLNNCFSNGHSIDNIQLRLQHMTEFFATRISYSGNNPAINCLNQFVDPLKSAAPIKIYPNPFSEYIVVKLSRKFQEIHYLISDQFGRQIKMGTLPKDDGLIDLREVAPGFYFIRFNDQNGSVCRLIKL